MKKRIENIILIILAVTAVFLGTWAGFLMKENLSEVKKDTEGTTEQIASTEEVSATEETSQTTTEVTTVQSVTEKPVIDFNDFSVIDIFPLSLASGTGDIRHCQGIAVDMVNEYIYYSYTTSLVKCDLKGNVIGTITGIDGHLGDIALNKNNNKIYASYNPTGKKALYVAIIDVGNLNSKGVDALSSGLIRTVHLKEVYDDFTATVDVNGKPRTRRYGVAGTDGVCFGPSFENNEGYYLTVACGISPQAYRKDNDYQILLQYDVSDWDKYAQPLSFTSFHHIGPQSKGKYFLFTGNTNCGVQTMSYFDELNLWLLNVYPTTKKSYSKFTMFVIDGDVRPYEGLLKGQAQEDRQKILTLYKDGVRDKKLGTYGWYSKAGDLGMSYLGNGLFYIVHPFQTWYERQTAVAYLYVWDPSNEFPFTLAAGIGSDYTISKKK